MTDRVSDETIDRLIEHWACGLWQTMDPVFANDNRSALTELRDRREAERHDPMSQALNEGDGSYRP